MQTVRVLCPVLKTIILAMPAQQPTFQLPGLQVPLPLRKV